MSGWKQNRVFVLVGIPGSGKTTWAKNQKWFKDCAYVSTDEFVEDYAKECGQTYSDVFEDYMPTAVRLMTEKVIRARESGQDIIWDQTSTTVATRAKKIRMLPDYYKIAVVFRPPEWGELQTRLASRKGKDIPISVIYEMIRKYEEPTLNEFDEVWST